MVTNNRNENKTFSVTDESKVGVIMMPLMFRTPGNDGGGSGADIGLDDIIDDNLRTDDPKPALPTTLPTETPAEKAAREAAEAAALIAAKDKGDDKGDKGDKGDDKGDEAVTVDGQTFKLDANGNAVKEDGTVAFTKEQLDELANPEVPLVEEVRTKFGIEILDETGKPKTYEDSVDGLMQLVNDVAERKLADSQKELFTTFPKVEKYLRHLAAGGNDSTFFNVVKTNYSGMTITAENVEQQKTILQEYYLKKGLTPEKANKLVNLAVDSNEIFKESTDALAELSKEERDAQVELDRRNQDAIDQNEKDAVAYWNKVNEVVTTGKLRDVIIPEAERKAFYEYCSKAVDKDRNSQAAIDRSKEDLATALLFDYYRFKKYDVSNLIRDRAATLKAASLRERVLKSQKPTGNDPNRGSGNVTPATDISLENLIPG